MSADKSFRNELLARYGETQARQASPAVYEDPSAAWPYYEANYRSMLEPLSREIRICEVGFTRESLGALLSIVFADVSVRGSRLARPSRSQRWFRRPLVAVLRRAFYVLGEGASDILFESRSLIAVARSPR